MIVECNQCHAKFRLDDAKITEKGVKVRCSKCKHVFTVNKQNASQYGKIEEAAPAPPPSPPRVTPKPAPPPAKPSFVPPPKPEEAAPKEDSASGFEFKDEPEPPPPENQGFDDGLGDLSFGEDKPVEPEPAAPPPAPDLDFGDFPLKDEKPQAEAAPEPASGETDDFGDFDFDDDISAESESSTTAPPAAPSAKPPAQDALDDMPDFSSSESDPPLPQSSEQADSSGLSDDFGGDDFGGADFDLGSPPPAPPAAEKKPPAAAPPPAGGGGLEEFGEISFDDAGVQGAPPSTPSSAPPPQKPAAPAGGPSEFGDIELDTGVGGRTVDDIKKTAGGAEDSYAFNMGVTDDSENDIPASSQPRQESRAPAAAPAERPRPQAAREIPVSSGKSGKKIFVVIVILALLGGGGFFIDKQMTEKGIKFGDLNADKIKELLGLKKKEAPTNKWEIKVRGFYSIERPDDVTLWVMRGTIINYFTSDKSTILIEGSVRDGDAVRKSRSMVANKIEDAQLKKLPIEKIRETLMNSNVRDENLEPFFLKSNATADFVIVFDNVKSEKPPTPDLPDEKWVVNSVSL